MHALCPKAPRFDKVQFNVVLTLLSLLIISACTTNPATGERQFTGLMSEDKENQVGSQQHPQILASFGGEYNNAKLQNYMTQIGQRVSRDTERPDVDYKFFLLDTPVLNAFAVPGGYIYATRGLMAAANSEAELAAVLAHEVAHITGRHSAERYSRGVLTSLGATVAAAAIGSPAVSRAIGIGANLYTSSYSRGQESEADKLGVRYLQQSGYDTQAMAGFLGQLEAESNLQNQIEGRTTSTAPSFFSTHPNTAGRVVTAAQIASTYPENSNDVGRDRYLKMIDGMTYGDSDKHGFVRGQTFYHPELGFTFTVPKHYRITNQPSQILATTDTGAALILDIRENKSRWTPAEYIMNVWMKDGIDIPPAQNIKINGMNAATTAFDGIVNGKDVTLRLIALQYDSGAMYRFQVAIPKNLPQAMQEDLRRATYSFRRMTASERRNIKAQRVKVVVARSGDTIQSLANRMNFDTLKLERFMALNGLKRNDKIVSGQRYKIVVKG